MALLGNIIWFFLGGWALFLLYALGAVIFSPCSSRFSGWRFSPYGLSAAM
ncbi:MAG: hypothetical protein ACKOCZ_06235 [Betaproteobacteria bacterium]